MNSSIQQIEASSVTSLNNNSQVIINQLIASQNDRCEGYLNAAKETKETDLKDLFNRLSVQSKRFTTELKELVPFINAESQPTLSENLFRAGIYVRTAVLKNDRCRVLSACEFEELMTINNYTLALHNKTLSQEIRSIINEQMLHITKVVKDVQNLNASTTC